MYPDGPFESLPKLWAAFIKKLLFFFSSTLLCFCEEVFCVERKTDSNYRFLSGEHSRKHESNELKAVCVWSVRFVTNLRSTQLSS